MPGRTGWARNLRPDSLLAIDAAAQTWCEHRPVSRSLKKPVLVDWQKTVGDPSSKPYFAGRKGRQIGVSGYSASVGSADVVVAAVAEHESAAVALAGWP